tara:strand:+ start:32 stop:181 length:150 start_codon:yes stop_codon:yes gene_type:complete
MTSKEESNMGRKRRSKDAGAIVMSGELVEVKALGKPAKQSRTGIVNRVG